jgi:hypothetical protein
MRAPILDQVLLMKSERREIAQNLARAKNKSIKDGLVADHIRRKDIIGVNQIAVTSLRDLSHDSAAGVTQKNVVTVVADLIPVNIIDMTDAPTILAQEIEGVETADLALDMLNVKTPLLSLWNPLAPT